MSAKTEPAKPIANIVSRLALLSAKAGHLGAIGNREKEVSEILSETYSLATIITKMMTQTALDDSERLILLAANEDTEILIDFKRRHAIEN